MASDSPRATTPRTMGSRSPRWRAMAESIGRVTCAIVPPGVRTATAQFPGLRIITPSRTACPPTVITRSSRRAWSALRARAGAGSARPVRRYPRASACPCRRDGTGSRSRHAARASSSAPGTCSRRSTSPWRAGSRDGFRPSSRSQDSSGLRGYRVASRDDGDDRAREVDLSRTYGGHRCSTGGLAGELRAGVEKAHRVGDLFLGHEDAVDDSAADLECELSRERGCEPVGDRVRLHGDAMAGLEPCSEGLRLLGLDGDDAGPALDAADDARDEAAAPDRHHDRAHVGHVHEDLEREGPVPGDHVRVVVGMDEDAPGACDGVHRALVGDDVVGRLQVDGRAVAARRLYLRRARVGIHEDDAVDAVLRRRPCHRLRVIPRRPRGDAAAPFGVGESGDAVERATRLERARLLEELRLEMRAERRREQRRRAVDAAGDGAPRTFDVDHTRMTVLGTGTGSVTVNAVRSPGSLTTSTRPLIASVNSFTIARPSPVPTSRSRPYRSCR